MSACSAFAATQDTSALVTAVKLGTIDPTQMIVRLYQPTNATLSNVVLNVDPNIAAMFQSASVLQATSFTALETTAAKQLIDATSADTLTLTMPYALTTVALSRP